MRVAEGAARRPERHACPPQSEPIFLARRYHRARIEANLQIADQRLEK
jgi:hypothetical protein